MARQLRRQPIDPGSPPLRRRRPAVPVPRHRSIWRPTSQRDKPRLHPAGPPASPGAAWIRTPPGTGLRPRSIHSRCRPRRASSARSLGPGRDRPARISRSPDLPLPPTYQRLLPARSAKTGRSGLPKKTARISAWARLRRIGRSGGAEVDDSSTFADRP